jgi:hypothetical protein
MVFAENANKLETSGVFRGLKGMETTPAPSNKEDFE